MILVFRAHALQRMFEREIAVHDVENVVADGKAIEEYQDDFPFPSRLILGFVSSRPLHVVAAENKQEGSTIIVTVYEPSPNQWKPGFEVREQ